MSFTCTNEFAKIISDSDGSLWQELGDVLIRVLSLFSREKSLRVPVRGVTCGLAGTANETKMSNISITSNDSPFRIITSPFSVSTHNYTCREDAVTTGNEMADLAQIVFFPEFCIFCVIGVRRVWKRGGWWWVSISKDARKRITKHFDDWLRRVKATTCFSLQTNKIKMRTRGKNENEQRPWMQSEISWNKASGGNTNEQHGLQLSVGTIGQMAGSCTFLPWHREHSLRRDVSQPSRPRLLSV